MMRFSGENLFKKNVQSLPLRGEAYNTLLDYEMMRKKFSKHLH